MKLYSIYEKQPLLLKLFIFIIISLILYKLYSYITQTNIEGFSQDKKFIIYEKINEIFDIFYADIYDQILFSLQKNQFEIETTIYVTKPNKKSYILDVGSGTGYHVAAFTANNINAIGIDQSKAMIDYSSKKYPESKFYLANANDSVIFDDHTFTHITCYYFSIYYIKDKRNFLNSCYNWLKKNGYLVLHLVNRDKFDPLLPPANPLTLISPQKYAKERITKSFIKFNNFDYKSEFITNDNGRAYFEETFKKKDGTIRKHKHTLFMDSQKEILSTAKDVGFSFVTKIDMVSCGYEYQYLVFLQKK
jgi:ubiquinone/menaquinone biosynthesis C-methylase UbiE